MYDQVKDQIKGPLISKLAEQLNNKGFNVSEDTINKAFANFPQLIQKIQTILAQPESKEKLSYVMGLITKAARGELTAGDMSGTTTSTSASSKVPEESNTEK